MQDGHALGLTSTAHGAVTITGAPIPVTLRITRSPMVIAGFDAQGRLTACESDGLVKLAGRTIVDSSASVMLFTLDRKPLEESHAVVLLPQPEVAGDVTLRLSPSIDCLEFGDVRGGKWQTHHQAPAQAGPDGIKFHWDADQSLGVVLLCRRNQRDAQVYRLTVFLQGYLDEP